MPHNGLGTAALVCGILALVIGLVPILGDVVAIPTSVLAMVFGGIGLLRAEDGIATNRGVALAGTLLGFVAGLLSMLTIAATIQP